MNTENSHREKLVYIGLIILAFLFIFLLIDYTNKSAYGGSLPSKNILTLTTPVHSFSGEVKKVEGDIITVTQMKTITQEENGLPLISPHPTPKIIAITYRVKISDKTQISLSQTPDEYLFQTSEPSIKSQKKTSIHDVKVGNFVTVYSKTDLRIVSGDFFEATLINLPKKTNTITGTIVGKLNNSIRVKRIDALSLQIAHYIIPNDPSEKDYTFILTKDTKISRKSEKITIADLERGMQVAVYSDSDLTQGAIFTALRVGVLSSPSATFPIESASASVAATMELSTP